MLRCIAYLFWPHFDNYSYLNCLTQARNRITATFLNFTKEKMSFLSPSNTLGLKFYIFKRFNECPSMGYIHTSNIFLGYNTLIFRIFYLLQSC